MRTIGLIGGMSWESSAEYYRIINQETNRRLGGVHSAQCLMYSVDFDAIKQLQHEGDWDRLAEAMKDAAIRLERGGADFIVLCTNTMHRVADAIRIDRRASRCSTSPIPPRSGSRPPASGAWACSARPSPWSRTSIRAACSSITGSR